MRDFNGRLPLPGTSEHNVVARNHECSFNQGNALGHLHRATSPGPTVIDRILDGRTVVCHPVHHGPVQEHVASPRGKVTELVSASSSARVTPIELEGAVGVQRCATADHEMTYSRYFVCRMSYVVQETDSSVRYAQVGECGERGEMVGVFTHPRGPAG